MQAVSGKTAVALLKELEQYEAECDAKVAEGKMTEEKASKRKGIAERSAPRSVRHSRPRQKVRTRRHGPRLPRLRVWRRWIRRVSKLPNHGGHLRRVLLLPTLQQPSHAMR